MLSGGWFSKESFDFLTKCFPEYSFVWSPGISLPNALQRIVFKESADFLTKCNAIHRVVW
jgi:hypothetical protein